MLTTKLYPSKSESLVRKQNVKDQQEQPPAFFSPCAEWSVGFNFTSTRPTCFADERTSMPGKAAAIFRNNAYNKHISTTVKVV